uniref:Uncharacterized protein n=1 Tax=Anguilla anguilla TaxID=7936 RepID=A0A0E9UWV3_ANGAN
MIKTEADKWGICFFNEHFNPIWRKGYHFFHIPLLIADSAY